MSDLKAPEELWDAVRQYRKTCTHDAVAAFHYSRTIDIFNFYKKELDSAKAKITDLAKDANQEIRLRDVRIAELLTDKAELQEQLSINQGIIKNLSDKNLMLNGECDRLRDDIYNGQY